MTLGDGNALEATGQGNVSLEMRLSAEKTNYVMFCMYLNLLAIF